MLRLIFSLGPHDIFHPMECQLFKLRTVEVKFPALDPPRPSCCRHYDIFRPVTVCFLALSWLQCHLCSSV